MKANKLHITETELLLEKVMNFKLSINQKLHAIKTFVIPHLDFRFLNTEIPKQAVTQLNKQIRGTINTTLGVKGLPDANIHASWRDG